METRLSNLAFRLWVARRCGDKSATARRIDIERARADLKRLLRSGWCPRYRVQREEINRRQRRALRENVHLFNKVKVFTLTAYVKKW
jgi:hypothetical protein